MTSPNVFNLELRDAGESFSSLVLQPAEPRAVVLFAVGAGGDPDRHLPLLHSLSDQGRTVVAPRFARLVAPAPSATVMAMRARRLQLAFDHVAKSSLPAAGVGHSIGAAILLMLAGAEATTLAGERVRVSRERRLDKLALMAPATDFFRAPGALHGVRASIVAWTGARDKITPPETAQLLAAALRGIAPVDVRTVLGAGHFSFMNTPPPHAEEPLADREAFLEDLAGQVASFIDC